jgi:hypothetical protein
MSVPHVSYKHMVHLRSLPPLCFSVLNRCVLQFFVYICVGRVRGGLEKKNKKFSEEDRRRTAIHEAGKVT